MTHWLVVPRVWDRADATGGLVIEHPSECGGLDPDCGVTVEQEAVGVCAYFLHADDTASPGSFEVERLFPGRYLVEATEGGLRLVS